MNRVKSVDGKIDKLELSFKNERTKKEGGKKRKRKERESDREAHVFPDTTEYLESH